ncbi:primase-helicase zinc-binding domain-containing protein [Rhizorhabdus histidinilytica]
MRPCPAHGGRDRYQPFRKSVRHFLAPLVVTVPAATRFHSSYFSN